MLSKKAPAVATNLFHHYTMFSFGVKVERYANGSDAIRLVNLRYFLIFAALSKVNLEIGIKIVMPCEKVLKICLFHLSVFPKVYKYYVSGVSSFITLPFWYLFSEWKLLMKFNSIYTNTGPVNYWIYNL